MKKSRLTLVAASILALAACSDAPSPVAPKAPTSADLSRKVGGIMSNYVAIGTSLSMGWASEGVNASLQQNAWPKQLAEREGVEFSIPSIDAPGCPPPFAAPLLSFKRIDG